MEDPVTLMQYDHCHFAQKISANNECIIILFGFSSTYNYIVVFYLWHKSSITGQRRIAILIGKMF